MSSLDALLASPVLRSLLCCVVPVRSDRAVDDIALVEDLDDMTHVVPRSLVLLTRAASRQAGGYRLDITLRMADRRGAAALVLSAEDARGVTSTAAAIAERCGMAILASAPDTDLGRLAIAIGRELAGDSGAALVRAHGTLRALEAHPVDAGFEGLLASAGAAAGLALSISEQEPEPGRVRAAPVRVDGHLEGWIAAAPGTGGALGGDDALGAELSVYLAAASAGRVLGREARERELPVRSREDVLSELLLATPSEHPRLVQRARAIGLPIDGWHVVVELDVEELRDDDGDQLSAYAARSEFGRSMLSGARIDGGTWHTARAGAAILLLRSYPQDPGVGAPGEVASSMDRVLARVRPRTAAATVRCGVGTAHAGGRGVLASAAEARAATTSARAGGRVNAALPFDSVGLRRALVEWYASDVAQDAVSTILQPLRDLGGGRGERLIQTLHVYLDQQRSLTRTGAVLHLHRNAVAYRIKQIFGLLDVDPENADDVLLLQLACRARGLS